ncbi:MAG: 4Fe-4S binding protein [Candidatus Thorarchaeota archaeon]
MERDQQLTIGVRNYCKKIGVDVFGFADPLLFGCYSEENRPDAFLKDLKTVIVIGFHLYDIILDAWSHKKEEGIWNYQFADAVVEQFCHRVRRYLLKKGFNSRVIPYSPGLYLKEAAALAGVGPIGKNNLLITNQFGSQVRLRALATTAPLICGEPLRESEYCKGCDICIEACPADAFINGKYIKEKCYTYLESHKRNLSDYTVIECNVCIDSCPIGKNRNDVS